MQDNRGIQYSAILHGVFFALIIFGLPRFMEPEIIPEPSAFSVDILPITQKSNVPNQEPVPQKTETPVKPVEATAQKATPQASKAAPPPPPPKESIPVPTKEKPVDKPKEKEPDKEPVKEMKEKEPVKKPEKAKEDDLDSILKSVKDTAKANESKQKTQKAVAPQSRSRSDSAFDPNAMMSLSEKDGIRHQIQSNWNVPSGVKDAQNLVVELLVTVSEDGTVTSVKHIGSTSRYSSEPNFRAAVDSAIRAVQISSPLKNLLSGKYSAWREMELSFNPSDVLN